ncbi:PAS domain-containing sensor histidine kinase [Desulforhopalus singaporensis]|uniref:histidine kinase n=1 Tax=Desulforhopalus singaporensis TaxID=91360 RepID=A0A1H0S583_9BACT|nr:PAS domain-containing sensor histidine kinase [Desulforhopalus singaporensis]SDP36854.1 PAS domain S-box-containing protein [Desulforhopalus singaporensis]
MVQSRADKDSEALELFRHRNRLPRIIREQGVVGSKEQKYAFVFRTCCSFLAEIFHCSSVWAATIDGEDGQPKQFACFPSSLWNSPTHDAVIDRLGKTFAGNLTRFSSPLNLSPDPAGTAAKFSHPAQTMIWPVRYQQKIYGFVVMEWQHKTFLSPLKSEFITGVLEEIGRALQAGDTALKLKLEKDFNKEIADTIQALMVSIRPCGTIVSFNKRAEQVTGFLEEEVVEKYWVDVLIAPDNRLKSQRLFSETIKGARASINFKAPLLTKTGVTRHISWHSSIKHDIEKGELGLVMLGIDETESTVTGQQLHMLTARWEKIFIAIQDPAMVVSNDNRILEANPATCAAARKRRDEVIGLKVCDILHGGHGENTPCPLEQFIGYQKTRITETYLHGLHGSYMLTVSPLIEEDGDINATFLLARNLTEEEVIRAEAIRTAQLATIGELASGVAHEINNPINGIINYAQIILDDPQDPENTDNLRNIITESKRIACIIANLLDFAHRRKENLTLSRIEKIVANSLQLVAHLLKKDGITCSVCYPSPLPPLMCNEQQLQQVVLNMISNARYALNKRFAHSCPEKILEISGELLNIKSRPTIVLKFTDHGIGIAENIQNKLFDPFFSTKPKGEGTGLGLSISHGLIRDHGGTIRVKSRPGEWSTFTIELPVQPF